MEGMLALPEAWWFRSDEMVACFAWIEERMCLYWSCVRCGVVAVAAE